MSRLDHAQIAADVASVCISQVGLAIATTTSKVKTGSQATYSVDGEILTKSASDPAATPSGDTVGNDEKALFLVTLDAGGNFAIHQSPVVAKGETVEWPRPPFTETAVGGVVVTTDSSTTYEPGTDDLNKSGVTTTYKDLYKIPHGFNTD